MFRAWMNMPREKRRLWALVSGAIIAGTVFKVVYFAFSRKVIVDDSMRKQREGMERLREAQQFAEWSKKDREARLPPLNDEQRVQMHDYLKIIEKHGLMKTVEGGHCEGCPHLGNLPKQQ